MLRRAGRDDQVRGGDPGRRPVAGAAGAAGRGGAAAARRVGVVEVGCAAGRPRSAPCAAAARPRRRSARWRSPRGRGRRRAGRRPPPATSSPSRSASGERPRCTASAPSGVADQADEAGGDGRVEHDRAAARLGLATAPIIVGGALGALAPDRGGIEPGRAAGEAEAEPGLATVLALGERLQVGVAAGRLVLAVRTGRGGDRDPLGRCRRRPPARPRRPPGRLSARRSTARASSAISAGDHSAPRDRSSPSRARRLAPGAGRARELVLVGDPGGLGRARRDRRDARPRRGRCRSRSRPGRRSRPARRRPAGSPR